MHALPTFRSSRRDVVRRLTLAGVALASAVTLGRSAALALAAVACNDLVTENVTLTADLDCSGTDGIRVGADGITVDLGGHVLSGDGTHRGVDVRDHAGVKVKNGTITGFAFGIAVSSAPKTTISGIIARDNNIGLSVYASLGSTVTKNTILLGGRGIYLQSDKLSVSRNSVVGTSSTGIEVSFVGNVTVAKNTVSSCASGIRVSGDSIVVTGNVVSANDQGITASFGVNSQLTKNVVQGSRGFGILLSASTNNAVQGNSVIGSQDDGIHVSENSDANTISKNKIGGNSGHGLSISDNTDGTIVVGNLVSGNQESGIDTDNAATSLGANTATANKLKGIDAPAGATDLGKNKASANGDPEQCSAGAVVCG